MSNRRSQLRAGEVIVFEGLDKAGKSTQIEALSGSLDPATVLFAHMPSGLTAFTQRVYEVLESKAKPESGLAQQLAHLACHAENMPALLAAVESQALVLDRWWWSTLAYGWYGGSVQESGLSEATFNELIQSIWSCIVPSVVFVFLAPHQTDENYASGVEAGYRVLMKRDPDRTVLVPSLSPVDTHRMIMDELQRRDIITSDRPGGRS
ncbi:MAG: hypothetical protein KF761_08355 [Salinibacterium sp.]|nr:hypothetical protein [Salinibacterium sp.]